MNSSPTKQYFLTPAYLLFLEEFLVFGGDLFGELPKQMSGGKGKNQVAFVMRWF